MEEGRRVHSISPNPFRPIPRSVHFLPPSNFSSLSVIGNVINAQKLEADSHVMSCSISSRVQPKLPNVPSSVNVLKLATPPPLPTATAVSSPLTRRLPSSETFRVKLILT